MFFINALQHYGYPALWLVVFIAAVGVPVSGSLLLFAAGAFAALGDLNIFILFPVAVSAAVMGDNLGYFIGRRIGVSLLTWLGRQKRIRWITPEALAQGQEYFRKRAGWAVFITRFLIVALGGPINLLAGLEQYTYQKFLFWDVSGQIISVLMSLGLGYAFAASWEEVASLFGAFSSFVLVFLIACVLFMLLLRRIRRRKQNSASAVDTNEEAQSLSQNGHSKKTETLLLSGEHEATQPLLQNEHDEEAQSHLENGHDEKAQISLLNGNNTAPVPSLDDAPDAGSLPIHN